MKELTVGQTAWLSGLLEGEGCFHISKEGAALVTIGMHARDIEILQHAHNLTGIGCVTGIYQPKEGSPSVQWRVSKQTDVYELIKKIWPWMFSRRQRKMQELLDILEPKLKLKLYIR